jgi:hypothetical protein
MRKKSVGRKEFITRAMERGLKYVEAVAAYEAFVDTVRDAMLEERRIGIGKVCSLTPVRMKPRTVHKGFNRSEAGVEPASQTFFLGSRIKYKVNVYADVKSQFFI